MESKKYFKEGDTVTLRQNVDNKPVKMVVSKIIREHLPKGTSEANQLLGIECFWFDANGAIQKGRFNCKDLIEA